MKTWFQNRRMKEKRNFQEGGEQTQNQTPSPQSMLHPAMMGYPLPPNTLPVNCPAPTTVPHIPPVSVSGLSPVFKPQPLPSNIPSHPMAITNSLTMPQQSALVRIPMPNNAAQTLPSVQTGIPNGLASMPQTPLTVPSMQPTMPNSAGFLTAPGLPNVSRASPVHGMEPQYPSAFTKVTSMAPSMPGFTIGVPQNAPVMGLIPQIPSHMTYGATVRPQTVPQMSLPTPVFM